MDEYLSLLGVVHPDGPRPARVVGSGWPAESDGRSDVIVLAPAGGELSDSWLERAVATAARDLAPDGLLYVLAPGRVETLLSRHGLTVESRFAHVPNVTESRFVISLDSAVPLSSWIPHHHWRQRVAQAGIRWGAPDLAARLLPVGLAARRPGARPLLAWLGGGSAVVSGRRYGRSGTAVLHRFRRQRRDTVVKVGLDPAARARREREAANLREMGPAATDAGARVPGGTLRNGVLVLTALEGQPAAQVLAGRPGRLEGTVQTVAGWLRRWNQGTRVAERLDPDRLLGPVRDLAPSLDASYLRNLEILAERCRGLSLPTVTAHHDLTMWNVLLAPHSDPAVLDWEMAGAGPPLWDLFYALADAAAAVGRYRDRVGAFRQVWMQRWAWDLVEEARASLDVPRQVVPLLFHICWLTHAGNEREKKRAVSGDRPFFEMARAAARHPEMRLD